MRCLLRRGVPIVLVFALLAAPADAGGGQGRRVWAGLDLFPSLLAADLDIAHKQDDGTLLLVLVYVDDREAAEEMARHLREEIGTIRKIPIRVELTDDPQLSRYAERPPAGIFLTQRLRHRLAALIRYGRDHRVIVFSPFAGDVERGVAAGILISDRILPLINVEAIAASGIRFKSFFLRIAERHG